MYKYYLTLVLEFICLLSFKAQGFDSIWYGQSHQRIPVGIYKKIDAVNNIAEVPVIVFLHGAGERGNNFHVLKSQGLQHLMHTLEVLHVKSYYIIVPQCPLQEKWVNTNWSAKDHRMADSASWPLKLVTELLDSCLKHNPVLNPQRIYITGLSMGGFGTWELAQRNPERYAAIMPICGGGDTLLAHKLYNVPVWAFHGAKDRLVLPCRSVDMCNVLKAMKAPCKLTLFKNAEHNIWNQVYSNTIYISWLLAQKKNTQGKSAVK
ncbi:MAG: dienelactone hydrolase family protein [Bacteroidia bacterium]